MPIDVDDAALRRLLQLQDQDTRIRRLQERRSSLPEAAALASARDRIAELDSDIAIARKQLDDLRHAQSRIEDGIATLEDRIGREEKRLFSGSVANPKELSSLQAEVDMLRRTRSTREDELLEVMVQREQVEAALGELERERAAAAERAGSLETEVGRLTGDIDAELREASGLRATIASQLPGELVTEYERVRDAKGGIGAARLQGGTCQGCHTRLPAGEVERLKREGGLQRCDNCRRLLVVTPA